MQHRLNADAIISSANSRNTNNFTIHGKHVETLKGKQSEYIEDLKKLRTRVDQEISKLSDKEVTKSVEL